MRIYLISDNIDTQTGLRLAGVTGCVVHTKEELKQQLNYVLQSEDIGILLITEKLSAGYPNYMKELKLNRTYPLVVEIPDRHGTGRKPNFITEYVGEAIGLKL